MSTPTRREFLRLGARTLAGAGLALGTSPWHTLAQAATGSLAADDYRALVCIYLDGGSDGFSLLVPTDTAYYNEYAQSRQQLAVAGNDLLPLYNSAANNPECGLHKSAASLQRVYDNTDLAFVSNVGTLVEPTSREQFKANSVQLPDQLFSHSDQAIQWQQLQGASVAREGWAALAAQHLTADQSNGKLTTISLDGSNYWQSGAHSSPFGLRSSGLVHYAGMDDPDSDWQRPRRNAFSRIQNQTQRHILMQAFADLQQQAMTMTETVGMALDNAQAIEPHPDPENELAAQLAMVARMISVRESLGMSRQIFFVRMGGWDVHDHQNKEMPALIGQLAEAMTWFSETMQMLDTHNEVTTFTASDFGRSLTGNGDGTDHGWGNHHMVMGGAVQGGQIFGRIPRLLVDGPDDSRNGRVLPSLSATQYAATLLRWLGLDEHALNQTLPLLDNFSQTDIGFV